MSETIIQPTNLISGAHIPHTRAAALFTGQDAAYPAGPEDAQILVIYIGGPTAMHVWPTSLANRYYAANPKTVFLPCYVDSACGADPAGRQVYATGAESGLAAVRAAFAYGFAANMPGDERRWIAVDAETNTNYDWYDQMDAAIWDAGFRALNYRSLSTQGPVASSLLWAADWTSDRPSAIPWAGMQYAAGPVWDLDVFTEAVYTGCGTGPRK